MSLPLLFKLSAAIMFVWAATFAFLYPIFCKKYEQKLIQQKEEEIARLQPNTHENESTSQKRDQPHIELSNEHESRNALS